MTERWCIPRRLGRASLLAEIAAGIPASPQLYDVRVVAPPRRTYQGKQARRQAFYDRQRTARHLTRMLATVADGAAQSGYHDAMRDALVYGMGWARVVDTWDRGSPDGDKAVLTRSLHREDGTIEVLERRVVDPSPVFYMERISFENFASKFSKR